jgi:hypothetical protein
MSSENTSPAPLRETSIGACIQGLVLRGEDFGLTLLNLPENHMFSTQADLINDAYRLQEERIAYDRSHENAGASRDGAA